MRGVMTRNTAKIEIVIDVHVEDAEVVWSVVGIVNDGIVGRKLVDVVDPLVEAQVS